MQTSSRSPFPEKPDFCERRGYHGPFANQEVYNQDPLWTGIGDCVVCGSTRMIEPRPLGHRRSVLAAG